MQNSIGSGESKDNSIKKLSNEDNGKTEEKKEPAQRRRKNRGKKNQNHHNQNDLVKYFRARTETPSKAEKVSASTSL